MQNPGGFIFERNEFEVDSVQGAVIFLIYFSAFKMAEEIPSGFFPPAVARNG